MIVRALVSRCISLMANQAIGLTVIAATAFAVLPVPARSQSAGNVSQGNEQVYLHVDKLVYTAGESVRYKVYVLNGPEYSTATCSKVLYFSLTDDAGTRRVNWRINLEDGPVSGHYTLPADLKSGTYLLRAYTNRMRNPGMGQGFAQPLLVMSLSESTPDTLRLPLPESRGPADFETPDHQKYTLKVHASRAVYATDETVKLEIRLDTREQVDVIADLSVSVSAVTPFQELVPEEDIHVCLSPARFLQGITSGPCLHRVEDKAFILNGRIRSRDNGKPVAARKILLAATDSVTPHILYNMTDSTGAFRFYLNRSWDNKNLILQFGDHSNPADYSWEIDEKPWTGHLHSFSSHWLRPEESTYLNTVKDLWLIEAVYAGRSDRESHTGKAGTEVIHYLSPPDWVVYPGDYAEMTSFKELVDNILPFVRFVKRNNVYTLQVLNKISGAWEETSLLLLNGVPYTDFNYIATLGSKEIQRIEVVARNYLMGDLTLPGLVSIYTFNYSIPENYLRNKTLTFSNEVIPPDSNEANRLQAELRKHEPDFRTVLFWDPRFALSTGESRIIEFPASQLKGAYAVKIRGLVGDGQTIRAESSFEVK